MTRRSLPDEDVRCGTLHPWSLHPGPINSARVDGSVSSIAYEIDTSVLRALSTRNGGEVYNSGDSLEN